MHKLDRLARSRADDVAIHFALKQAGVTLVSTSENIDETPSGMLMHGIMSSIAEFYSRNLANEVTKGLVQKASLGGTVGVAPLGYRNVTKTDDLGRTTRTVEVDASRGDLITWAFFRYSEGDSTLASLLDELTARGLTTRPSPKRPSKPLNLSALHRLMHNPYYKGEIHYRGVIYPGAHQPLVDPATWQRVQNILAANDVGGTHQRINTHYLRGSLFCGDCGSRLMLTNVKNAYGTVYPYYVCTGRFRRVTDCTRQAMLVDHLEQLIEDEYRTVALSAELRDTIEAGVLEDFEALQAAANRERSDLEKERARLTTERQKPLEAHYAGAIPLDLLKSEQDRIGARLTHLQQQLTNANENYERARSNLADVLDLSRDCHAAYMEADDVTRRLFNQAFFEKIYIDEDDTRLRTVRVTYNEPFETLLGRVVPAATHAALQAENKTARQVSPASGFDVANPAVLSSTPNTLVAGAGFEPATSGL